MKGGRESGAVAQYALDNAGNFEAALAVWMSFDTIKERLFRECAIDLERALLSTLNAGDGAGPWKAENTFAKSPLEKWKGLYVYRTEWKPRYDIGLEANRAFAGDFLFGIRKPSDTTPSKLRDSDRLQLDGQFGQGGGSKAWEWFRFLGPPYETWEGEILMEVYRKTKAVDYLVNRLGGKGLAEFARIAAPLIEAILPSP